MLGLMRTAFVSTTLALFVMAGLGQDQGKWTSGTITSVKPHTSGPGLEADSYDVSIKVGDTIYTVRYAQQPGTTLVQYREGADVSVFVGEKTLKVNDTQGVTREGAIISREPAPPKRPQ
jgi:hypothetical protein